MPTSELPDFAARRQAPAERLTAESLRWLEQLPLSVRPQNLAREFPRIANALSHQWDAPQACLDYLDELLIDRRGNRRGFRLDILLELAALKGHFETMVHPAPQTVWGDILLRSRGQ